jgi:hypothetical protein
VEIKISQNGVLNCKFEAYALNYENPKLENKVPINLGKDDKEPIKIELEVSPIVPICKYFRLCTKKKSTHYFDLNTPGDRLKTEVISNIGFYCNDHSYDLELTWTFTREEPVEITKTVKFILHNEHFKRYDLATIVNDCNAFDLKNLDFLDQQVMCLGAQHRLCAKLDAKELENYKIEILHVPVIQWTSIRVLSHDEMHLMAMANLIGSAQLPAKHQMKDSDSKFIVFDPKVEKAMLIKDARGDYAIVKGAWSKWDYLDVTIYYLRTNASCDLKITSNFKFVVSLESLSLTVDMQTATIIVKSLTDQNLESHKVECLIAIVMSILTLHVLLEPKQNPFKLEGGELKLKKATDENSIPFESLSVKERILSIVGYNDLLDSKLFMKSYQLFKDKKGKKIKKEDKKPKKKIELINIPDSPDDLDLIPGDIIDWGESSGNVESSCDSQSSENAVSVCSDDTNDDGGGAWIFNYLDEGKYNLFKILIFSLINFSDIITVLEKNG